jgi:hypothetical protein
MNAQTLTIGKRRFVVLAEGDYNRLVKSAKEQSVRSEFAEDAMRELRAYRKTRKAKTWDQVKSRLGL